MPTRSLRRILVAIADPEIGGRLAIARARQLASHSSAAIELFNAIALPISPGRLRAPNEHFVRAQAERNQQALERKARRLTADGYKATVRLQTGYRPAEAILAEAERIDADLVIIEARRHRLLARLFLANTDLDLIRHGKRPLLIVKGKTPWRRPRVLAALVGVRRTRQARSA